MPMESNVTAQVLRSYLALAKCSQQDFARKVGVTQGQVSHWVSGRKRITAERARDIEAATNGAVTRHELRPDLYPPEAAPPPPTTQPSTEVA